MNKYFFKVKIRDILIWDFFFNLFIVGFLWFVGRFYFWVELNIGFGSCLWTWLVLLFIFCFFVNLRM